MANPIDGATRTVVLICLAAGMSLNQTADFLRERGYEVSKSSVSRIRMGVTPQELEESSSDVSEIPALPKPSQPPSQDLPSEGTPVKASKSGHRAPRLPNRRFNALPTIEEFERAVISQREIAEEMTAHLTRELAEYSRYTRQAELDPTDLVSAQLAIQHGRLLQSALNSLAKWSGLDRAQMQGDTDAKRIMDKPTVQHLSLDEMREIVEQM